MRSLFLAARSRPGVPAAAGRRSRPRHRARCALATVLALTASAATADAAFASPTGDTTLMAVEGTIQQVVVDSFDEHAEGNGEDGGLVVDTMVEVDGALYDLPEEVVDASSAPEGLQTGDDVEVTVRAEAPSSPTEALASAADGTGLASVVAVVRDAPATDQALTDATVPYVLGDRALTLLPVYWGTAPASPSIGALTDVAAAAADYWSEQSAGGVRFHPVVREWRAVDDPGTCDTAAIMRNALAAYGLSAPGARAHVAVYFPARADCGNWAGMGSVLGSNIWINGVPTASVLAHELGHNLGIGHANTATCTSAGAGVPLSAQCTVQPYADVTDVMGFSSNAAPGNLNVALADQLGLASVLEVDQLPATVDLAPLADVSSVRGLKLATSLGTLYVEFRPAQGRDVRRTAWAGVQVRRLVMEQGYPHTDLLDMQAPSRATFSAAALPQGGSWDIPGTGQRLTVTATTDAKATLALQDVTPAPPAASSSPVGALDLVTESPDRGVQVTGWAVDADTTGAVTTHIYVDGRPTAAWSAGATRSDVGALFPQLGANHGFSGYLALARGRHTVCAYGINVGSGGNTLLGCRDVTVTNRPPMGALEAAVPYGDRVKVSGWAFDPDTAATINVHVYVDGAATVWSAVAPRPDIKARYPGQSDHHGFTGTIPAAEGAHTVCVYGIDANGSQNALLGCKDIRVVNRAPIGSLDWVAVSGTQLSVGGWTFDPDSTASIPVHVYVDGAGTVLTANSGRADVKAIFPGQSANHGFTGTVNLARGRHTVCVYGIDMSGGTNALLGCRTVSA